MCCVAVAVAGVVYEDKYMTIKVGEVGVFVGVEKEPCSLGSTGLFRFC